MKSDAWAVIAGLTLMATSLPTRVVAKDKKPLTEQVPHSEPAACTFEGQPGGTGTVTVSSESEGAEIYVDGRFTGDTPSTLKLSAGSHTIQVKSPGRKTWERTLEVLKDSQVTLKPTLEPESQRP